MVPSGDFMHPAAHSPELDSRKAVATKVRYGVVAFGVGLAILSYIDRIAISQAAPLIASEFGFSKAQMGVIFSAFLLSYGLFEIPGAWYGDYVGARKGLIRISLGWSAFTALTGMAWNFTSMVAIRFVFGAAEAGCFPIIAKSFRNWLQPHERTRATGILWMCARWGGAFTPLLVVFVLRYMSWRAAFAFFGAIGMVWAFFFARWYRDSPEEHPSTNDAERQLLQEADRRVVTSHHVPWGKLLTSRSILLLSLQYFFLSFSWFFYSTWLPTYLQEHHHLSPTAGAAYSALPLFFCGVGSLFCGFFSPYVTRWTGSIDRTRKIMAITGFLGAGTFLSLAPHMDGVNATMAMMAIACFFNDQVMPHAWASTMDIGGKQAAASVAGAMNLMGSLAGTAMSLTGGLILQRTGNDWNLFLAIMGGVYFLGVFCWPFIDSTKPLEA